MLLPWTLLVVFNILDIWTTYEVLERGGVEGNPIAGWLIENGLLVEGKLLLLAALGFFCFRSSREPSKGRKMNRVLWIVTGFYALIVFWNFLSWALIS